MIWLSTKVLEYKKRKKRIENPDNFMSDNNHSSTPYNSYYHERGGKQKKQIYDLHKRLKLPKDYNANVSVPVRLAILQKMMAEKKLRDTKEVKDRKKLKGQIRYRLKTKNISKDLLDENLSLEEQLIQTLSLVADADAKGKEKVTTDLQSTPTLVTPDLIVHCIDMKEEVNLLGGEEDFRDAETGSVSEEETTDKQQETADCSEDGIQHPPQISVRVQRRPSLRGTVITILIC